MCSGMPQKPHGRRSVGYMGYAAMRLWMIYMAFGRRATGRRRIAAQEHSLWRGARSRRCHRLYATPTKSCRIAASGQGRPMVAYMGYAAMRLWMIYGIQDLWLRRLRAPYHRLFSIMRYAHTTGAIYHTQRRGITASRFSGRETGDGTTPNRGIGIWATGRRIAAQEHSLWRDARSRRCHRLQDTHPNHAASRRRDKGDRWLRIWVTPLCGYG